MCILQIQYVMHFPVINKMTFCFNWRSLGRGGCLFRDILGHLRESAYLHQAKGHHNSLIALYHAGMANKDLEYILHEFSKPDSILRLIICTIAFGMGILKYTRYRSGCALGSVRLNDGLLARSGQSRQRW